MIDVWPVQVAVFEAMTEEPTTYDVLDAVKQGQTYPYLVIGEITAIPDEELEQDSADASFTVHAWSRYNGKKETHELLAFARERLHGKDIGGGVWAISEDFAEVMEDPSSTAASRLYHGVARYRIRAN